MNSTIINLKKNIFFVLYLIKGEIGLIYCNKVYDTKEKK